MKKFWKAVGAGYMFFKRGSARTPLLLIIVILVQFILLITLLVQLNSLKSDFFDYREASMKRINQTYGQVFSIQQRINR